ncbi:MAG: ABC transporter permease [Actinomycetota bacterium]|nr:ABC transporter permease [Actinomycetota bacterium]
MATSPAAYELAQWELPPPVSRRRDTWRRFRASPMAATGISIVGVLAVLALGAPLLTKFGLISDPYEQSIMMAHTGPSAAHPLGTDYLGRDLLSRAIYGARISLSIALLLQIINLLIGSLIALPAGYLGGWPDNVLMRFTDAMFAFPTLLFVLVIAAVLGPGYWNTLLAMGLVSWVEVARLMRGQVLAVKEKEYIEAARASGTPAHKLIMRHIVPNAMAPVMVSLTFGIPMAIFSEAFLSFVGVGMRPPTPSWGVMIKDGYQAIFAYPHEVLVPTVAVSLATLGVNFVGDGLRDALDPRMRK